jgi:hypothetical protein
LRIPKVTESKLRCAGNTSGTIVGKTFGPMAKYELIQGA